MEISLDKIKTRSDPYQLFLDSIRNSETLRHYKNYLHTFLKLNSNEIDTSLNLDYEQISQLSKTLSDEIISIENIGCNDNLVKMFKSSDDSSVCVKPSTAEKLVQRGWGTLVN